VKELVKICIVGGGNISNTRHIPALKKVKRAQIVGVISNRGDRAKRTADQHKIMNYNTLDTHKEDGGLRNLDWLNDVDAVVIGAPPREHFYLVKLFLNLGKHVLVEKPMTMNEKESKELIELSKKKKKIFYVMHNFQYARNMQKLTEVIETKQHGDIVSITEVQFTNHDRRLPEWYNDLPMGLFYDEAAHFLYLLEKHGGKVRIDNSYAVYDDDPSKNTPKTLNVGATAGKVPVTMVLNFNSPVCEWYYIVNFKKHIYMYDFFKDILIKLPTDNQHLAKDILLNSIRHAIQYWSQFVSNGARMFSGRLLYGHQEVLHGFVEAVAGGKIDEDLTAKNGHINVVAMNEIVNKANRRK